MNENIDLTKILKDCPKGEKFWSPLFGEVEFECNVENRGVVKVSLEDRTERSFNADATITIGYIKSIEIMLYPSKYQRDWSKFTAPWYKKDKFDPKTLQSFDRVIARDAISREWRCDLFSHIKSDIFPYRCVGYSYIHCIPYNDDTKHLIGTKNEAPEFYRHWEN